MNYKKTSGVQGFSLIELMVGLTIGLMASLVIANVMSTYEKQKRTTTGNSDAQTNGAIALYNIQRDVQSAGYGLPLYGSDNSPLSCPVSGTGSPTIDHDGVATTTPIGLSPIVILDSNGPNASDTISIRMGDSMRGGAAQTIIQANLNNTTIPYRAGVNTNLGCRKNDVVLIMDTQTVSGATNCAMTRVRDISIPATTPTNSTDWVEFSSAITINSSYIKANNALACLGAWNEIQYTVTANNQLARSGAIPFNDVLGSTDTPDATPVAIVPDIVNIQAQYGISASASSNKVTEWVNATGVWGSASLTTTNRNRIKLIHIAVVARNGLLETTDVTAPCSSLTAANPTGLCAWDGSVTGSAAPAIDLTAVTNWRRYRYRVYESIVPIKSVIWSWSTL